ncbi:hypothetical protein PDO_3173 [Rhizobium sp. PDO1-076]|uniref:hypothetical protein n=1 Tax=Rhizobium sp. PDO1-076 TaxID=1125979 RepID=UPI00024E3B92|nr:hypothetical protein [Rhizobium sp. PDO1-076]EHS49461.1 hypothetical protein PDO_3173 [Rhizobium sp. PDO1-076]
MSKRNANLPPSPAPTPAPAPSPIHVDDRIFRTLVTGWFKLDACRVRACHRHHLCSATSGGWPRCLAVLSEAHRAITRTECHAIAVGARDKLGRDPDPWPVVQGPVVPGPVQQAPAEQGPVQQASTDQADDAVALHRRDVILLDIAFGFRDPVHGNRVRDWVRSDPEWQSARAARCAAKRAAKSAKGKNGR